MLLYNNKPFADYFFNTESNCCVWCKTEESARRFCEFMHNEGKMWQSGNSFSDMTNWDMCRENTVYFKGGTYGDLEYANSYEYMILEMDVDIVSDDESTFGEDFSEIDDFLSNFIQK